MLGGSRAKIAPGKSSGGAVGGGAETEQARPNAELNTLKIDIFCEPLAKYEKECGVFFLYGEMFG